MKKGLILLILLFLAGFLRAQVQNVMYQKIWGGQRNGELDYADELENGDFIVIGKIHHDHALGSIQPYIARLTPDGNLIWEKDLGYLYIPHAIGSIYKTHDGKYLIHGTINASGYDPYLICVDQNGDEIFEQVYAQGGGLWDDGGTVVETTDSGYLMAVNLNVFQNSNRALCLIKVDQLGNELWRTEQDSLVNYVPTDLIQNADGTFILAGYQYSIMNPFLARISPDGNIDWVHYPDGKNNTQSIMGVRGLLADENSGFSVLLSNYDSLIEGISTNWIWFDSLGTPVNQIHYPLILDLTFLCVNYPSFDPIDSCYLSTSLPYSCYCNSWIFSISPNNTGAKYIGKISDQDSLHKSLFYTIRTRDGGYFSVGTYAVNNSTPYDLYAVKFNKYGEYKPEDFLKSIEVFPNPSPDGNFTLRFDQLTSQDISVNVWSPDGKVVFSQDIFCPANSFTEFPLRLDLNSAASGMYILELRSSGEYRREKLVIEKP